MSRGRQADVHRAQRSENVCLQERNQGLQRIHEYEQQEPRYAEHAADKIERLDAHCQEHTCRQSEDAQYHMACEHISVKSNCQRKQTDDGGDDLQQPDDGHHDDRKPTGSKRLQVAETAMRFHAPEDEVHERDKRERPCNRDGAGGRFAAGDQSDEVADQDEEEQRGQERNVLLIAVPDNAFAHIVANELVAVLHGIDELVRGYQRQLTTDYEHHHKGEYPADYHPQGVLGKAERAVSYYYRGIKRFLQFRYVFRQYFESVHAYFPSFLPSKHLPQGEADRGGTEG